MDCFPTFVDRSQIKKKTRCCTSASSYSPLSLKTSSKKITDQILLVVKIQRKEFFLNILYFVTFEDAYKNEQKEKNNDDRKKRWKVERTGKDK